MGLLHIVLALPLLLFFLLKWKKTRKTLHPPGPRGLPFIGNLHQIDNSAPHQYLWKLSKKYGPLMSLQLGFVPTLVISSASLAKEVMKTQDLIFCSRPNLVGQQKLSYNGLDLVFSPYNDYYREIRKICTVNLFSSKRVQSFRPIREDEVHRMIKKISEKAVSSKLINLSEIFMSLASTIICRIAFCKRYEDEGSERSRFHGLLNESQAMMGTFFVSDHFPLFGWVDKLTGLGFRLEKNFGEMDRFYQELIDDHLDPKREKSTEEDIIDILIQMKEDQSSSIDITFDHIKALLMNIFVAGTDTSAATLVWAMTGLMKNPRVMKRVQDEVRNLIGKKGTINEENLEMLPYLKAVVKETMRLYSPVPLLVQRETIQKCVLNGYEIQPKTLVYVNAWAIGRDEDSWKNPEEFLPERFMNSTIDFKGQDFELIPFGAGRRGCPGISMGVATVELALTNLLYSFDWELPGMMKKEDIDTDVIPGITMHKKNALCLLARPYDEEKCHIGE